MLFTESASRSSLCMVENGKVVPLLKTSSNHLKNFPIYRNLLILQIGVNSTNVNSPYPVSVEQLLKFDIFIM